MSKVPYKEIKKRTQSLPRKFPAEALTPARQEQTRAQRSASSSDYDADSNPGHSSSRMEQLSMLSKQPFRRLKKNFFIIKSSRATRRVKWLKYENTELLSSNISAHQRPRLPSPGPSHSGSHEDQEALIWTDLLEDVPARRRAQAVQTSERAQASGRVDDRTGSARYTILCLAHAAGPHTACPTLHGAQDVPIVHYCHQRMVGSYNQQGTSEYLDVPPEF
jgi:hypothetical protein